MPIATEIQEARALLERAEGATDPQQKASVLEEALALLESCAADDPSDAERTLIANLRRSHTRRLLVQLVSLASVQMDVWFGYIKLLFFELQPEVESITQEDAQLRANYERFLRLWRQEALDILGREPPSAP